MPRDIPVGNGSLLINFDKQYRLRDLYRGVLAEQVPPYTNQSLSVSPLTWSHATVVATVLEYLDRLSELSVCEVCGHPTYMREAPKLRHVHRHHAHEGADS